MNNLNGYKFGDNYYDGNEDDEDEDDVSIRSLFSHNESDDENNLAEQPTFLEPKYYSVNSVDNNTSSIAKPKIIENKSNIQPFVNDLNVKSRKFLNFSPKKNLISAPNSIFSLPSINPNRKMIRFVNPKPVFAIPQNRSFVVKSSQSRPELFTKIVYSKPQNNVLISIPAKTMYDTNKTLFYSKANGKSMSSRVSDIDSEIQNSVKSKVIHHYNFYEHNQQSKSDRHLTKKRKYLAPTFNSQTQVHYSNSFESEFLSKIRTPSNYDANYDSNGDYYVYQRLNFHKK